jgi:hypothetical protein
MAVKQFDYDSPSVPASAIADVVREIQSAGKLLPLSDAEREQRRIAIELYRWECRQREEERRLERDRQQAEAEAVARQEAALEIAEANRKARLERQEQIARETRNREIRDLQLRAARADRWQSNVDTAAWMAIHQRQQTTLIGELEKMLSPPAAPPEPESGDVADDKLGSPNCFDENWNPNYYRERFWEKFRR